MSDNLHELPGPILLLAGPGTGKTYRLGKRIKYLVEEIKAEPDEITVITFTSAASRNMRQRISDAEKPDLYVPYDAQPKLICTMHSLGHRILLDAGPQMELGEDIHVLGSDEQKKILLGDAAQLAGFNRADAHEAELCRGLGHCTPGDHGKCKICAIYQQILRSCSAVDYDDQILLACTALEQNGELLEKWQNICTHLLVDEYQDINAAQFRLIKLITQKNLKGLFVVGDDDQSIYSWRGGSPDFIRNFADYFGEEAKIEPLTISYRCPEHILEGSTPIVKKYDPARLDKGNFEYKVGEGPKIFIHNTPSDSKEANIVKAIVSSVIPARSVLILYPHAGFAEATINALKRARINFTTKKDFPGEGLPLIAELSKWLTDQSNSIALRICIEAFTNNPALNIPSKLARKPDKKAKREEAFLNISRLWQPIIEGKFASLWESLEALHDENPIYTYIFSAFSEIIGTHQANDDPIEFASKITNILMPWKKPQNILNEINAWVDSSANMSSSGIEADVQIMSFQGAKGLEASVVCVIGLQEGTIPRYGATEEELSEQSRLMFVAMTRAEHELHLFHARNRSGKLLFRNAFTGKGKPNIQQSCFLEHIPAEHKENIYHKA